MILFILGVGTVLIALILGNALLTHWAKDSRRPFPEEEKLLREPGHSLLRKVAKLDRDMSRQLLIYVLVGLTPLVSLTLKAAKVEADHTTRAIEFIFFVLLLLVVAMAFFALASYARRRRNLALGAFGERVVAEHLEPLKTTGHRVFHDVPAGDQPTSSASTPFNIDHVVVGPAGVFAIETKTRRKGRARVGFMAHEIIYDGRALAYPWGEDQHGLEQARRQAGWLAEFLQSQLGRPVPVQALLVFPGWMIIRKGRGEVNVLNPKELPAAIAPAAGGHAALDEATINLVARHLETRCRDVEL